MTSVTRKRRRSEDSPCAALQTKMHINQKIIDQNNSATMKEIQAKTIRNLFEAARHINDKNKSKLSIVPLSQQITLYGDGRIDFRNGGVPNDLSVDRRSTKCCAFRRSFVQDHCSNCNFDLCEECGFSCWDCGSFLCRGCVAVFGCGTADHPICEKCAIFN